jgi:hypothetical protein
VVKVVDFKPLGLHHCGFESQRGLWILVCEEVIQSAYGMLVVLLWCLFMSKKIIMHGRVPDVFLHQ